MYPGYLPCLYTTLPCTTRYCTPRVHQSSSCTTLLHRVSVLHRPWCPKTVLGSEALYSLGKPSFLGLPCPELSLFLGGIPRVVKDAEVKKG